MCSTILQVQERICDALAKKIEKQLEIPQRQQMIFELMGRDFVSKYFPDRQYDHAILVSIDITQKMGDISLMLYIF